MRNDGFLDEHGVRRLCCCCVRWRRWCAVVWLALGQISPGNGAGLAAAAAVCAVVEGLPLGIELAAARLAAMTVLELRTRIEAGAALRRPGRLRRPT